MKPLVLKVSIFVIGLLVLVFSPKAAQAGFFFWQNSQTMTVLQAAPLNKEEAVEGVGGGDVTIDKSALLSEVGPLGTAADVKEEYLTDQISTYIVRPGDTISGIAKMFNVTPGTIMLANDIKKGEALKEGTVLVILPISGAEYTVKQGDTLNSIAKKFGTEKEEISRYNGVTNETVLAVDTVLIIPDGEIGSVSGGGADSLSNSVKYAGYYLRPFIGGRKTQGIHGRNGVDLAAPTGTKVMASADGTVLIARASGWNGGYGKYVVIKHPNGTQTLYSHLNDVLVTVGIRVEKGETIGTVGNTGRSTGSHLHFEIRGGPRNPF